ncbi:MAG: hypothetical protein WC873_00735 [Candidatus Gracilibacteria bacterium]
MQIALSWDLFVLVFFVVIVAYSFIIGRDNTLKVILGTYVAALAADASGSLFAQYFGGSALFKEILDLMQLGNETQVAVFIKVLVFVILVILFAVRGAFSVNTSDDSSAVVRLGVCIIYAVLSAGLIVSIILVFVSGVTFIGGGNPETTTTALSVITNQSPLIRMMLTNAYVWFALPAIAFLIDSLTTKSQE